MYIKIIYLEKNHSLFKSLNEVGTANYDPRAAVKNKNN